VELGKRVWGGSLAVESSDDLRLIEEVVCEVNTE